MYNVNTFFKKSSAQQEDTGFGIVFCGHSLGGATASLLAMLFRDKYPSIHIECFAYAPPPVVDAQLAEASKDVVTSYVWGADVVPSLSWGTVHDFCRLAKRLGEGWHLQQKQTRALWGSWLGLTDKQFAMDALKQYSQLPPDEMYEPKLCLAGTILHAQHNELTHVVEITSPSPENFHQLRIAASMWSDHFPKKYEESFEYLLGERSHVKKKKYRWMFYLTLGFACFILTRFKIPQRLWSLLKTALKSQINF